MAPSQAYIPGMDREDIEVFVSGPRFDVATVKGVKLPTDRELLMLLRESRSLEHMLRLGANRYIYIWVKYSKSEALALCARDFVCGRKRRRGGEKEIYGRTC